MASRSFSLRCVRTTLTVNDPKRPSALAEYSRAPTLLSRDLTQSLSFAIVITHCCARLSFSSSSRRLVQRDLDGVRIDLHHVSLERQNGGARDRIVDHLHREIQQKSPDLARLQIRSRVLEGFDDVIRIEARQHAHALGIEPVNQLQRQPMRHGDRP